jgi:hypothetical protein
MEIRTTIRLTSATLFDMQLPITIHSIKLNSREKGAESGGSRQMRDDRAAEGRTFGSLAFWF